MSEFSKNLQPASFRQVAFEVHAADLSTGRRNQTHEYPQRDKPYCQDMGRATRNVKFEAFVVGADYVDQANRLLSALEAYGPGTLVHPWFGSMQVSATADCSVSFNNALGYAKFSLHFIESGDLGFPSVTDATGHITRAAADGLLIAANDFFGRVFRVAGFISYVADKASRLYGAVLQLISSPLFALAGMTGWRNLPGNLSAITPLFTDTPKLAQAYSGLIDLRAAAVAGGITGIYMGSRVNAIAGNNVGSRGTVAAGSAGYGHAAVLPLVRSIVRLVASPGLSPPFAPHAVTANERQAAANHAAILAHTRQVLLSQAAWLSSYLDTEIYDDTTQLREELVKALDAETVAVTDDAVYTALMAVRGAVWKDLTDRSRGSARLLMVTPPAVLPALVLAYDRYENAARDVEVVTRNKIRNPGYVPVMPLKFLSK